uniref:DNA primase small subunit n=1 Tax=Paramoeba aestuarina TaxID=180227 RepID=A0A7S4JP89_9EUKA|mmetsp:Transcript_11991/g.18258  ORF Transcript_11991/g.18258 Transcript_11991/m.18258 type:complete len:153 (+) Transcript_11991:2-460(+)
MLKASVKKYNAEKNKGKYYQNVSLHKEIAFQYSYPRLDVAVSKGLNHLLKSPFCAHPKTGKICVPIDPMNCEKFSPKKVPTLSDLVEDIDRLGREREKEGGGKERDKEKGWKGTRLQPYVKFFQNSFLIPMQKEIRASLVKNNGVSHDEEMF